MQTARIGSSIHYLHLSELWNGHIRSLFESYAFDKFLYEAPYTDFLLTLTLVP
ncbi:uncharacterized protein PHALS_11537 [Plasmopara halstedii]|uniref:Uncharacterized protein n=1 Tax=Plasmopara halstedii TaxID=4781 RepID=A0A0P1A581_PLAHL|nr:uncharacterized protein PHALS_11537 [Plasmopara halstedii]CEG35669.1 hypothetical protein PHALS_11537 [Plasmopara halstedii]|eukprot:XP_024572038.1 hypothetical protein PHALS_11537 [Plasmopara halstedii]